MTLFNINKKEWKYLALNWRVYIKHFMHIHVYCTFKKKNFFTVHLKNIFITKPK